MSITNYQNLAAKLWQARQLGNVVTTDEQPTSLQSAYELLNEVTKASECELLGYKLGATTDAALDLMQLSEPFVGPLLKGYCHQSGHTATIETVNNPAIEAEFVLCMADDLPTNGPLSSAEVAKGVAWIAGGFEIVGARFATMPAGRGLCTIGDGAGNHSVISGKPNKQWRDLDIAALPVELRINGNVCASGMSNQSLHGSPLAMLTWLANSINSAASQSTTSTETATGFASGSAAGHVMPARGIKAGDIIYCGTCTGLTPIQSGDTVVADYGALGEVVTRIA